MAHGLFCLYQLPDNAMSLLSDHYCKEERTKDIGEFDHSYEARLVQILCFSIISLGLDYKQRRVVWIQCLNVK